jgi:hypothetical protein
MGGTLVYPGTQGGTNWYPPSYSPRTGLFYVTAWDNYSGRSGKYDPGPWQERVRYTGSTPPADSTVAGTGRGRGTAAPFKREDEGYGAIRALDPNTGAKKWDFKMVDFSESGVLSTGSDLVFAGGREGNFFAVACGIGLVELDALSPLCAVCLPQQSVAQLAGRPDSRRPFSDGRPERCVHERTADIHHGFIDGLQSPGPSVARDAVS